MEAARHARDHSFRDFGAGDHRYLEWHAKGDLFTSPGRAIDPGVVASFIAELHERYNIRGLAYDRWRVDELLREFDRIGLAAFRDDKKGGGGGLRLVPYGQGFRDLGPAIDALEVAIMERKLVHANVPILNWSVGNAVAVTDPAGNRKIDKEKARMRVDGAVALAMCMGLRARDRGSVHAIDVNALIG